MTEPPVKEFYTDKWGEDAADALEQHFNVVDEITVKEIKLTSDLAWAQTMYRDGGGCTCGAESRVECRCRRTEAFKKRAEWIRDQVFPEEWGRDPFQLIAENIGETAEHQKKSGEEEQ